MFLFKSPSAVDSASSNLPCLQVKETSSVRQLAIGFCPCQAAATCASGLLLSRELELAVHVTSAGEVHFSAFLVNAGHMTCLTAPVTGAGVAPRRQSFCHSCRSVRETHLLARSACVHVVRGGHLSERIQNSSWDL